MIFIDEPYLVSIGSSFVNIDHGAAFGRLDEVIAAIRQEGSLVGLHCCGNTDWGELLKRDIDILSFDAYNFAKEFSVYARDVANFLSSGRTIAWGVVPSSGGIDVSAPGMLSEKLRAAMKLIAENGAGNCRRISSIITPSCGVGSLTEDQARSVMDNTRRLSEEFQKMRDAF
jgi:hypothetical protein